MRAPILIIVSTTLGCATAGTVPEPSVPATEPALRTIDRPVATPAPAEDGSVSDKVPAQCQGCGPCEPQAPCCRWIDFDCSDDIGGGCAICSMADPCDPSCCDPGQ